MLDAANSFGLNPVLVVGLLPIWAGTGWQAAIHGGIDGGIDIGIKSCSSHF